MTRSHISSNSEVNMPHTNHFSRRLPLVALAVLAILTSLNVGIGQTETKRAGDAKPVAPTVRRFASALDPSSS